MNREIDFEIAAIQHVIKRMPDPDWKLKSALNRDLHILGAAQAFSSPSIVKSAQAETFGCSRIMDAADSNLLISVV